MSLGLFEAFGVELEYMVVGTDDLDVLPLVDVLFESVAGQPTCEVPGELVSWSNELAAHVLEFKTSGPARTLSGLSSAFQAEVARANASLAPLGARLLGTACHPWMDPGRDSRLWSGEGNEIYETFDRLFGSRAHGWLNLQSMHLNLPFAGDAEFDRLHSAIRLVLPLLPGLAASSPYLEGRETGHLDSRLLHYRTHCARVSCLAGTVIPEPIASREEYERVIYGPIRRAIPDLDPSGTLRPEWTNARGAIARFDRNSIEIRLIDLQECPRMDLAVASLVIGAIRDLVSRNQAATQREVKTEALVELLGRSITEADHAQIGDPCYLRSLGLPGPMTVGEAWKRLRTRVERLDEKLLAEHGIGLDFLERAGPLARRILAAAGPSPSRSRLREVYLHLADCLEGGRVFEP